MDLSPQVNQYILNIVENGTSVNQEVDVDVEEQTEVIRVPKHNNVDALELMNDFISVIMSEFVIIMCNTYQLHWFYYFQR